MAADFLAPYIASHMVVNVQDILALVLNNERICNFYPRPVLAFGYCRCISLCVYQSLACPHDNSGPVQASITNFKIKNYPILSLSDP